MAIEVRRTQNQYVGICAEHPTYSVGWQLIFSSETTSAGTPGSTTLVDASRDSGGADTYNGRYWVRITSGANKGLWARVLDDNGSGSLTLEGADDTDELPNTIADNTTYELWKSPEAVVVIDSSSDATDAVDAERDEPNDYWNGHYLVPLNGDRRGEKALITDFVSGSGTFTLGSGLSGALSAGDVCVMRKFIDVSNVSYGLSEAFNPRPINRLDGTKGDGSIGPKGGTFGFDAYAQSGGYSDGQTYRPPLAPAIQACGFTEDKTLYDDVIVSAGSTTTDVETPSGSWETTPIGCLLSVAGEMAFVTALADGATDTLTVSPALGVAPGSGATLPVCWNYQRNRRDADGDYHAVTIEYEVDGIRTIMTGCKGNLTISGEAELMMGFEFQVSHWIRQRRPSCVDYQGDAYSSSAVIQATERRCYLDATAVELGGITASLNNEVSARNVQGGYGINGRAGFSHASCNPGATVRRLATVVSGEHLNADEAWLARTEHDLMIFWGNLLRNGAALRIPAARLVQDPTPEDEEGRQVTPYVLEAHHPGTYTDPDSTVHKIPDFVIAFA